MTTAIIPGQTTWSLSRDEKGHRTYKIKYKVRGAITDGPGNALLTTGLPVVGSQWVVDGENDPWASCRPEVEVTPLVTDEPNTHWSLEFTFSTKPLTHCQDDHIENPLLIPQVISGSFVKYTQEATIDRFGYPIRNSAHELIRGHQVEFDLNRMTIKIKQNVADLQLPLLCQMTNTVNDDDLWGIPRRCIKLNPPTFERKFYGTCSIYYERNLEFDIFMVENPDPFSIGAITALGDLGDIEIVEELGPPFISGHDRTVLDEGTKVLHGGWNKVTGKWVVRNIGGQPPDPDNPQHFERFKDIKGEACRVILNGKGLPAGIEIVSSGAGTGTGIGTGTGTGAGIVEEQGYIRVEFYNESDFTLLGIPLSF
jgi:hypothetical protein